MCKLSVIVPIYNVEPYLAECLTSIFAQDIDDMEVIAIIDGSPDNSVEIAREFAAQHPNMRVIEQENRGISSTRNRGIREAKGDYICWIDSDDYYNPNALTEVYRLCVENDLDFIGTAFHQFPYNYEKCAPTDGSISPVMDGREYMRYTFERNYLVQWPSCYMYKRSFILANDLFFLDGCVFEGSPFALKLASVANRCMYYNAPVVQYRIHEKSISHSKKSVKVAHDILKSLIALVTTCDAADIPAEYMPYFSDLLCKRVCFCAITFADLTEAERKEYKAMCTSQELMYFHSFVSPIFYRNWLVKKNKRNTEDLEKKVKALNKKVAELNKTIASQQTAQENKRSLPYIARAIKRKAVRAVRVLRGKLFGASRVTYIEYQPTEKDVKAVPLNELYRYWIGNIVSTEATMVRYKNLLPKLYYHLVWRDDARTPLALDACGDGYGDNFEDLIRLLSDGRTYTLLPSYFTDRKNISIRKRDNVFLWDKERISAAELRKKLKGIGYDSVIAEDVTTNALPVHYLHDEVYLDIVVLNNAGNKPSAKVTDAYLTVKNTRAKKSPKGYDAFARIQENTGSTLFGLPGKAFYKIRVEEWKALRNALCDIVEYLAVYDGIQFRVVFTKNGPKIVRMTGDVRLPEVLHVCEAVTALEQRVEDRVINPTEEIIENNKIFDERKAYWEKTGSKRHWPGFRPYMGMMFDTELEIDSQDPGIAEEDKRWCYERGFFAYRMPEIGLCEDNYRDLVPDYEYFWVNRINNDYQNWIANKLLTRFVLDEFKDHLPRYYYNVRNRNRDKRIIALPDLPEGYTQSIDSIIRLVKNEKKLAIKKTYGSHGEGFVKFTYTDGAMYLNDTKTDRAALEQFLFGHEGLYLITEYVEMHPFIASIYPGALNTVRVNCMNKVGERGVIGACFLKVGHAKGGYTDNINTAAGGIMVDMDKYTGAIRNSEFKRGNWYTPCPVHPDTGVTLEGTIPHWDMVIDGVKRIANALPQIEYMGFDIAITPEGFKVIEINVFPDYTKFLLKDEETQEFLKNKVTLKKKREKIAPDRHSWLD